MKETRHGLNLGRHGAIAFGGILWAACVLTGIAVMAAEEFTPVQTTSVTSDFPAASPVALAKDEPTLLLFLHPHCPCSRATARELEKLLARTQGKVAVTVIFPIPAGTPPGWEKGDLWNWAHALAGARVYRDEKGSAARQFGVVGSGHTLLYTPAGRLVFSGGITASRGEEGDNPGEDAIADFILNGHAGLSRTPVFGCPML